MIFQWKKSTDTVGTFICCECRHSSLYVSILSWNHATYQFHHSCLLEEIMMIFQYRSMDTWSMINDHKYDHLSFGSTSMSQFWVDITQPLNFSTNPALRDKFGQYDHSILYIFIVNSIVWASGQRVFHNFGLKSHKAYRVLIFKNAQLAYHFRSIHWCWNCFCDYALKYKLYL